MDELHLVEVGTSDRTMFARIGRLRVEAWRTLFPGTAVMTTWLDEYDGAAHHWAVLRGGEPVASARLSVHGRLEEAPEAETYLSVIKDPIPTPVGSFNRMVVNPTYRRRGLSKQLDAIRLQAAKEIGCRSVVGETPSGEHRVRQLASLGFQVVGAGRRSALQEMLSLSSPPVVVVRLLP